MKILKKQKEDWSTHLLFSLKALGVFCPHRLFSISLVLSLSATSHLLVPAWSITISLD